MNEEIINQAIETSIPAQADIQEPIKTDQAGSQTDAPENKETPELNEPEETPFPKKAVNALSRRDKQIGKLQAQLAAERAELAKFREREAKSPVDDTPKEDSYQTYGEYLKAVARYEAKQELSQTAQKQQEQVSSQREEAWIKERSSYAAEKANQALASIPDYKQLFMENADIVQSLPSHVERAFLEADEPALAFYALAKEGKLDALSDMSFARAAIEIGKAEIRGEALSKAKPVTKTPAPIESLKGAGNANKSLNDMSSKELLKWLNS